MSLFRLTLPLLLGYVPLAIAFAVAWMQAGLPAWGALLASVFLYAGSMQFLLIGLLVVQANWETVFVAALAVNLRHIFYGLSFPSVLYRHHPLAFLYSVFALTDEGFSLVEQLKRDKDYRKITIALMLLQIYWVFGTLIGILIGAFIPVEIVGFDFALCGVFVVLAQNHYYHRSRRPAMLLGAIGMVCGLIAVYLFGVDKNQLLLIAISVLTVLLLGLPRQQVLPMDENNG
ncbi:AzlC family ABC transporter permease [Suttonella ornithocola]|uniref:Inner membrane protein YgaZ n=1 Tax=Suttonella ornithocola TaxID=279832 RepID=A0A380MSP2_9GAMM|nr:AzlC family ABC transporter permease [Suttonella ornithocola]SUO95600.1 Inner membrane protein YgaZ [Suttonella ornithocola]